MTNDPGRNVTTSRLLAAIAVALASSALPACGRGGPGLALAGQSSPTVRVLLGRPAASVTIRVPGGWEAAGGKFRSSGTNLATTVTAGDGGLVFRGRATGADLLRLRPDGPFVVDGAFASAPLSRSYLGSLLLRREGGTVTLVNEIDLETYVVGVIANEMGPGASAAAYRAQAVAARTYAYVSATGAPSGAAHHLRDTESSQVYRGLHVPTDAGVTLDELRRRVLETRGVVLTWASRPFPTYYASTCGGHTTDAATSRLDPGGATEPLSGVPCSYCGGSRYFQWTSTVTEESLLHGLRSRGVGAPISGIAVTRLGKGGWASEVTVTHGKGAGKKKMAGQDFRSAAGLRSFKITAVDAVAGGWQVSGAGWGHGVGMCQVGAMEMARRGMSETDILRYYYPGAEFTRLY